MNMVKGQVSSRFVGLRRCKSSNDLLDDDTDSETECMDDSRSSHSSRSIVKKESNTGNNAGERTVKIGEMSQDKAPKKKKSSSSRKEGCSSSSSSSKNSMRRSSSSLRGSTSSSIDQDDQSQSSRSSRPSSRISRSKDKEDSSRDSRSSRSKDIGDSSTHSHDSRSKDKDDLSSSKDDNKKSRKSSSSSSSSSRKKDGEKEGRRSHRSKLRKSSSSSGDQQDLDYLQLALSRSQQNMNLRGKTIHEERKRVVWAEQDSAATTTTTYTHDGAPPPAVAQEVFLFENQNTPDLWWNQKELEINLRDCMRVVASMRVSKPGKKYVKAVTNLYNSYKKTSSDTKSSKALQAVANEPQARGLELHIAFPLRSLKTNHIKKVVETQALLLKQQQQSTKNKSSSIQSQIRKEAMKHSRPCRQFAFMIAQYDAHAALKATLSSWQFDHHE